MSPTSATPVLPNCTRLVQRREQASRMRLCRTRGNSSFLRGGCCLGSSRGESSKISVHNGDTRGMRHRVVPWTAKAPSAIDGQSRHKLSGGNFTLNAAAREATVESKGFSPSDVEVAVVALSVNSRRVSASVAVPAAAETVWATLTDYDHLGDFIPSLAVNQVLLQRKDGARILQVWNFLRIPIEVYVKCRMEVLQVRNTY